MGNMTVIKEAFKPPLLVFCLTVLALALTLFAYSLSLEVNSEKILNPDVRSWNSFFKSVSALGVCLLPKNMKSSPKFKETYSDDLPNEVQMNITTVSFLTETILIIDNNIQAGYYVHVTINGEEIGYSRDKDFVNMIISYSKLHNKDKLSCVTVTGPSFILPDVKIKLPSCTQPKQPPNGKRNLVMMETSKLKDEENCPKKHFGTLVLKEKEILNVYLSKVDINLIQLHIVVMSCALCAMVLIFFLYSVLKKVCKSEKKVSLDDEMVIFVL
ncbi:hypothetical protein Avbf_07651 [Armadillidium vulgare]|nr:hypothetical protein Avbf_07651 [Armadillidium vulgare]